MRRLIDLRKGHPKAANLQHQRIALACRQAASRLDVASEASFPLQYTIGSFGTPRFLGRLTRFLEDSYGGRCFEDGLLTTNGVSHGIELACGALTSPGDSVWMETPSYFLAHQIFVDHGLNVQGVPSDAHGLDTDALARMLSTAELGRLAAHLSVSPTITVLASVGLPPMLLQNRFVIRFAADGSMRVFTLGYVGTPSAASTPAGKSAPFVLSVASPDLQESATADPSTMACSVGYTARKTKYPRIQDEIAKVALE